VKKTLGQCMWGGSSSAARLGFWGRKGGGEWGSEEALAKKRGMVGEGLNINEKKNSGKQFVGEELVLSVGIHVTKKGNMGNDELYRSGRRKNRI